MRYVITASLAACALAVGAPAAPLLSFVPPTDVTMILRGGGSNSHWGAASAGDLRAMTPAQWEAALRAGFFFNNGPAACISLGQLVELSATASTLLSSAMGEVQLVVSGRYRLTERATVTRTIFQHWIHTSAWTGSTPQFDSAQASTFTTFEIDPFTPKTYTHPLGQTVTSQDGQGLRGGGGKVGPHVETRVLDPGDYSFRMELFVHASSSGLGSAHSAIRHAGFRLCAVPEPASIALLVLGSLVTLRRR